MAAKPTPYMKDGHQRMKDGKPGWKIRPTIKGVQLDRTFYGSYEEAVEHMATIKTMGATANGKNTIKALTVQAYMLEWLKKVKFKVPPANGHPGVQAEWSTYRKWYDSTSRIIEVLGGRNLKDLTYDDCVSAIAGLQRQDGSGALKPTSKATVAGTLKLALRHAVRDGYLPYNPAAELPTNWAGAGEATRRVEIPSFTQTEAQATAMGEHYGDVLRVLAYTGLRISELVGLRIKDVDFLNDTLHVHTVVTFSGGRRVEKQPKTATSTRQVPILEHAVLPLKRLIRDSKKRGSEFVVCGERGASMSMTTWNRTIAATRRSEGAPIEVFTAHAFRHTYASGLLAKGVPVEAVAAAMGHSSTMVTQNVYRHVIPLSQKELAKKLSAAVTELVAEEALATKAS